MTTGERIEKMLAAGATVVAIAAAFGKSEAIVYQRLHRRERPKGSDDCHGDCGRWVAPYLVGQRILGPPDHCGGCARAISPQAIADEAQRVRDFWGRTFRDGENGGEE